jgi:hypothetical protein
LFFSVSEFLDEIRDGCLEVPGLEGSRPANIAIGGTATGWSLQPIGNRLSALGKIGLLGMTLAASIPS